MPEAESFTFGFQPSGASEQEAEADEGDVYEDAEEDNFFPPAKEVVASSGHAGIPIPEMEEVQVSTGLMLMKGRVTGTDAAALMHDERVTGNDLIPGMYEGGFKLWECSVDLAAYLLKRYKLDPGSLTTALDVDCDLQGKKVFELGCGHGLPGIVALMAGADVYFQDFNEEVLRALTIPNVITNMQRLPTSRKRPTCKYIAGEWSRTAEHLTSHGYGGHFDVILASETLYSEESQERLLQLIKQMLQPPLGVAFIASKRYYFGVGGGTQSFRKRVKADGLFELTRVACVEDPEGGGNVREILKLAFPESIQPYFM